MLENKAKIINLIDLEFALDADKHSVWDDEWWKGKGKTPSLRYLITVHEATVAGTSREQDEDDYPRQSKN